MSGFASFGRVFVKGADEVSAAGAGQLLLRATEIFALGFAFLRTPQPLRLRARLSAISSRDRSSKSFKVTFCRGVLPTLEDKPPVGKLQKRGQFSVLLLKCLNTEPQRLHDILS